MNENNFFEKCGLELCWTAMIKPRQIECSGLFLVDSIGQTRVYRLVLGPMDVCLRRKRLSLMKDISSSVVLRAEYGCLTKEAQLTRQSPIQVLTSMIMNSNT